MTLAELQGHSLAEDILNAIYLVQLSCSNLHGESTSVVWP